MAEHCWTIVCEKALVNEGSNTLSLIEIIEEINIAGPAGELDREREHIDLPFSHTVVTVWTRSDPETPESGEGRITLEGEPVEGLEQSTVQVPIDLASAKRMRTIINARGLRIAGPGTLWFVVACLKEGRWTEVGRTGIDIRLTKSPPQQ
jgi:hypothetical protein